jgi:hypothetical protein
MIVYRAEGEFLSRVPTSQTNKTGGSIEMSLNYKVQVSYSFLFPPANGKEKESGESLALVLLHNNKNSKPNTLGNYYK